MKMGMSLEEAGSEAMRDLRHLVDPFAATMSIVALDAEGRHAGFSNVPDTSYIYMSEEMDTYEERPRTHVPAAG
jgi:beta-aspartyl-peptidase (threonine type)